MFRSRRFTAFVGVLLAGMLLLFFIGGPLAAVTGVPISVCAGFVIVLAVLAAAFVPGGAASSGRPGERRFGLPARGEFLCDSCRYNNLRDCSRPERPNATACDEYRAR